MQERKNGIRFAEQDVTMDVEYRKARQRTTRVAYRSEQSLLHRRRKSHFHSDRDMQPAWLDWTAFRRSSTSLQVPEKGHDAHGSR